METTANSQAFIRFASQDAALGLSQLQDREPDFQTEIADGNRSQHISEVSDDAPLSPDRYFILDHKNFSQSSIKETFDAYSVSVVETASQQPVGDGPPRSLTSLVPRHNPAAGGYMCLDRDQSYDPQFTLPALSDEPPADRSIARRDLSLPPSMLGSKHSDGSHTQYTASNIFIDGATTRADAKTDHIMKWIMNSNDTDGCDFKQSRIGRSPIPWSSVYSQESIDLPIQGLNSPEIEAEPTNNVFNALSSSSENKVASSASRFSGAIFTSELAQPRSASDLSLSSQIPTGHVDKIDDTTSSSSSSKRLLPAQHLPQKKSLFTRVRENIAASCTYVKESLFVRQGFDGRVLTNDLSIKHKVSNLSHELSQRFTRKGRSERKMANLRMRLLQRRYADPNYFTIVTDDVGEE